MSGGNDDIWLIGWPPPIEMDGKWCNIDVLVLPITECLGGAWRVLLRVPAVDPLWRRRWRSAGSAVLGTTAVPESRPRASPASRLTVASVWCARRTSAAATTRDGRPSFVSLCSTWPGPSPSVSVRIKPNRWPWPTSCHWKSGQFYYFIIYYLVLNISWTEIERPTTAWRAGPFPRPR